MKTLRLHLRHNENVGVNNVLFSGNDQDILKVLKMNQDICQSALDQAKAMNAAAETSISETDRFIDEFKKKHGIDSSVAVEPQTDMTPKPVVSEIVVPDWHELVETARTAYPDKVSIEDILTQEEYQNAMRHLDSINDEFSCRTRFKKVDWEFFAIATALQCVRQYILDPWIKKMRAGASPSDEKGRKGNVEPGWYHADTDKILESRVPFDAQGYSNYSTVAGFLKGGGHRTVTLGHDPIMGWVFGTANILTNTLTRFDFQSAHIKNIPGKGNTIYALADTSRIFSACKERLMNEGWNGKIAVGSAVIREAIHLKSDVNTKKSLPLPVVSVVSPEFAEKLCSYGIDTASVGTEIGLSIAINTLISMVHRLFYDESVDNPKLYEVRTRKIILYSNTIASVSNVIAAAITKNLKILDVGGLLVTITRLFTDIRFIARVKQEFVESQLDVHFNGIIDEIEEMNKKLLKY